MYEQVLDGFRKAAEATMQAQQEMFRQWAQQVSKPPAAPTTPAPEAKAALGFDGWGDQMQALQKQYVESITRAMEKHRETLDAQYKAGIRTIEDAFRVSEAKDPEQFRRFLEELWRHAFEALKSVTEAQLNEFRSALQQWSEAASEATATATAAAGSARRR